MELHERPCSTVISAVFYSLLIVVTPVVGAETSGVAVIADHPSALEYHVLSELNRARTHPRRYASTLMELRRHFRGKELRRPENIIILTKEGVSAVDEAIGFLRRAKPCPPLELSRGMSQGARDHVKEQGPSGATGHDSADGGKPWDRVSRYGEWKKSMAENISYGSDDARMVVMSLIIDDGVPDRGHRKNIFNPEFQVAGVACGPHSVYGTMCVITFAAGYRDHGYPAVNRSGRPRQATDDGPVSKKTRGLP